MSEAKDNKSLEKKVQEQKVDDKKSVSVDSNKSDSVKKLYIILSVLFFIIFSVVLVFLNNQVTGLEKKFNKARIESNSIIKERDNQIKDALSRFTGIQEKLEELGSKQDVLSHSLSQPIEQQIQINEDYALDEIEHLLIMANYKLQLDHDITTALSAMEAADARLKGLRDPAVLSVRKQLIVDMNTLRTINQADLSGLGLFLSDLIDRIDDLPLKENAVLKKSEVNTGPKEEQVKNIRQFFILVWKELKSLVIITRDQNVNKARILPDEIYFLRANMKLELANARFAVFNRDTDNLRASISHMQDWLKGYFDLSDAAVRNIYDSLSRMKKLELAFPELDISSSLESVRAFIHYQDEKKSAKNEEGLMPLQ